MHSKVNKCVFTFFVAAVVDMMTMIMLRDGGKEATQMITGGVLWRLFEVHLSICVI